MTEWLSLSLKKAFLPYTLPLRVCLSSFLFPFISLLSSLSPKKNIPHTEISPRSSVLYISSSSLPCMLSSAHISPIAKLKPLRDPSNNKRWAKSPWLKVCGKDGRGACQFPPHTNHVRIQVRPLSPPVFLLDQATTRAFSPWSFPSAAPERRLLLPVTTDAPLNVWLLLAWTLHIRIQQEN